MHGRSDAQDGRRTHEAEQFGARGFPGREVTELGSRLQAELSGLAWAAAPRAEGCWPQARSVLGRIGPQACAGTTLWAGVRMSRFSMLRNGEL